MSDLELRAIRQMYQSDFPSFCDLAFRLLHPGIEFQRHFSAEALGAALALCHQGETNRLIINMPPRSLKSIFTSVALPAWILAVEPETKIICVAGHRGLADDQHALTCRLMSHPKYRSIFPHVRFTATASKINLPHGGFRSALTPSGALTGRGADLIIIDDPQAPHEADDPAKSGALRNWYDRNIYQRFDDKSSGVVIVAMQRLAPDDLTAHLLGHGDWEHLCFPAIATEDERFPATFGDRIVRKKGDALNPKREDRERLRSALHRVGAQTFMAQYQQDPYPPGEGVGRGGAFHVAPYPGATEEECKGSGFAFGVIPEETFLLDRLFGEATCLRSGPPPRLTEEEFMARYGNMKAPQIEAEWEDE